MQSFTDEQLMMLFRNHKDGQGRHALDCLYSRYAMRLLNYFYYSLQRDSHKAQDFLHDLFLKIIENQHQFDANQSFKSWIFRIASNMCKNEYRSYRVIKKYEDYVSQSPQIKSPEEGVEKDIRICMNELDPDQRSLLILRFRLHLSVREIAEINGCPEGTIKSRLFYATKELSKLYKQ